jgi:hypothetical protein
MKYSDIRPKAIANCVPDASRQLVTEKRPLLGSPLVTPEMEMETELGGVGGSWLRVS